MLDLLTAVITQAATFLPMALAISISYNLLRATDMTLDASFVLGAGLFARLLTLGVNPLIACACALLAGAMAGTLVSTMQRGGRIDPLLAGVLATFILSSVNLLLMGRPNINLLNQVTLVSSAFAKGEGLGWMLVGFCSLGLCAVACLLLRSHFGLALRAFGDNPGLLQRQGRRIEFYRLAGFSLTNMLAAGAGVLTAQTVGYADIGMSFGLTLTGIGAIILGQQLLRTMTQVAYMRVGLEFLSCVIGILLYFLAVNGLLRFDIDPVYLKLALGILLMLFLRAALKPQRGVR
jgi:putative ABC transport system permease protein